MNESITKVGIAGLGALGTIVAEALLNGLDGYTLHGISDLHPDHFKTAHPAAAAIPVMDFATLARECDLIVECLPPAIVPALAQPVLEAGKTLLMISSCALVLFPEIKGWAGENGGRIIVPSGALSGLDAVAALATENITEAKIKSSKPPKGFKNAPYIIEKNVNLEEITAKTLIFSGNVMDAAKAFPANVNVAASLALAGIGPEKTRVEVWADPDAVGNAHEITVSGPGSVITARVENVPDPSNPKSSKLAGYSLIAALKKMKAPVTIY